MSLVSMKSGGHWTDIGRRMMELANKDAPAQDESDDPFDHLPPVVRDAISSAPFPIRPEWAMRELMKGATPEAIAEYIHKACEVRATIPAEQRDGNGYVRTDG